MKPDFLQQVLKEAAVHPETRGTRIEYDTESFHLSAEYSQDNPFDYKAYDLDDKEVTLTDDQQTIVYEFVYDLHYQRETAETELRNQF